MEESEIAFMFDMDTHKGYKVHAFTDGRSISHVLIMMHTMM